MFKKSIGVAVATALAICAGSAFAAAPQALLTIQQSDGRNWLEDVTGLLAVDAQSNFSLIQGIGASSVFQNGQFVSAVDATVNPDYWQWKTDASGAGSWNWHSAETLDGTMPAVTDASNPWMSAVKLNNISGHGDPDLAYAILAINNSTHIQTYSFAVSEAIFPALSSPNVVHADIAGVLTSTDGSAMISPVGARTTIQQLLLSADHGASFVDAGVDVGPQVSATGTSIYGAFAASASGPTGQSWNFMQIGSKFTLTGRDIAGLVGFASVAPVPEPETLTMLLAGLGLMGFKVRRRKSEQSRKSLK
jgi:hypothetical protein